jgi:glycosyltransferase involved in cell wall biosynthesis
MNIVIFSTLEWTFLWQRPHHIASKLAEKGHNVIYFDSPDYVAPSVLLEKMRKHQSVEIKKIADNLCIVKLYLPEFRGSFAPLKNYFLVRAFKSTLKKLDFIPNASIFYSLDFVPLIKTLDSMGSIVTYDCVDDQLSFVRDMIERHLTQERAYNEAAQAEIELIKSSAVCFATAQLLLEKVSKYNPKSVYLPNAMDFDHFNAAKIPQENSELTSLKHPTIGFIGAIYEWIDFDLICQIAETHPEYSVLLVGPVKFGQAQMEKYSNIIMVGTKPYETLPTYLSNMDVCLIPFKLNDVTLSSNPIKMYEYLAAGKPVVSTPLPEVQQNASEIVYIGKNNEDFIKKVDRKSVV